MKKTKIFMIIFYCFVFVSAFSLKSIAIDNPAGDYYKAKAAAKIYAAAGLITETVGALLQAEVAANSTAAQATDTETTIKWRGIADWQRNNAAFILITDFKTNTNWDAVMQTIKDTPNGPERLKIANELKSKARAFIKTLETAETIINAIEYTEPVKEKADNNKDFIIWVKDWIKE